MDLPALTEKSKTKIAPIVSTVKSASVILRLWERKYHRLPDLVVVEGPEAGGHLGFTEEQLEAFTKERYLEEVRSLIRLVKEHGNTHGKDIPVALAGGIYEKKDVEEAWKLGADAVQLGTRFVTTYECDAADAYNETYLHARKEDIELVKSPVGMPGRAIHNAFLEETRKSSWYPSEVPALPGTLQSKNSTLLHHQSPDCSGQRQCKRRAAVLRKQCLAGRKNRTCIRNYAGAYGIIGSCFLPGISKLVQRTNFGFYGTVQN